MARIGPAIPTLVCLSFGIIVIVIGVILISTGAPKETIWFSPALCRATGTNDWYSAKILAGGSCPVDFVPTDSTPQDMQIQQEIFSMDGLPYNLAFYRTAKNVKLQLSISDSENTVLYKVGPVSLSDEGPSSIPVTGTTTTAGTSTSTSSGSVFLEDGKVARKLLKGGRGSTAGRSYSRSSSSYSRYGSRTYYGSTYYGYHSCCVPYGSRIYVYHSGYHYNRGYYDTTSGSDCGNSKTGCAYEVAADLVRDEFNQLTIWPTRSMKWPLKLTIIKADMTSTVEPQFFFAFFTESVDNATIASYVFLPIGCLIFVAALLFFCFATR